MLIISITIVPGATEKRESIFGEERFGREEVSLFGEERRVKEYESIY